MIAGLRAAPRGTQLVVHVQPGACRAQIVGGHGDALKVRIDAPPVEGAANEALLDFMARSLGVPRREVKILRGEKSRRKLLEIRSPAAEVTEMLARRMMGVTVGEDA